MIQPLSNFVFLEYEKQEEKEGILISEVSNFKPATAKVVAVGPGKMDRFGNFVTMGITAGDRVAVDPFIVREVKIENINYLVIREDEIFAKL